MREYRFGPKAGVICAAIEDVNIDASNVPTSTIKKYLVRIVTLFGRKSHFNLSLLPAGWPDDGVIVWWQVFRAMLTLVNYARFANFLQINETGRSFPGTHVRRQQLDVDSRSELDAAEVRRQFCAEGFREVRARKLIARRGCVIFDRASLSYPQRLKLGPAFRQQHIANDGVFGDACNDQFSRPAVLSAVKYQRLLETLSADPHGAPIRHQKYPAIEALLVHVGAADL